MLIALVVVSVLLAIAVPTAVSFYKDARFYHKLYHNTDNTCVCLIDQNKRLINILSELHEQNKELHEQNKELHEQNKEGGNFDDEQHEE